MDGVKNIEEHTNPSQFLNIIVRNGNVQPEDRNALFPDGEAVFTFNSGQKNMFDLLVILGVFKSRGQARKNWRKTGRDIPPGWTQLDRLGKYRKELCIWNPTW
jgi:hypothetical protein